MLTYTYTHMNTHKQREVGGRKIQMEREVKKLNWQKRKANIQQSYVLEYT